MFHKRYRHEELTTEEKEFIQYIQKNPFITSDTFAPKVYYRMGSMLSKGIINKILQCILVFFTVIYFLDIFSHFWNYKQVLFYLIISIISSIMLMSIFILSYEKFEASNPNLIKEIKLQNIRVIERTLYRNRRPIHVDILEETSKYFKIRFDTTNAKIQKIQKKEDKLWRVIQMNAYYYIYFRANIAELAHMKVSREAFEALNSSFLESKIVKYEEEVITKEAYEALVEESKYQEWYIRDSFVYILTLTHLVYPFVLFAVYEMIRLWFK